MPDLRRVVITGIGAITPIGTGAEQLWTGLQESRSAVQCVTRFDPTPFKSRIAAQVNDFVATDHLEERPGAVGHGHLFRPSATPFASAARRAKLNLLP